MNRVEKAFKIKNGIMIGYLAAGYPDFEGSIHWIEKSINSGFDIIEIGLPFSDPVADGPTIQKASKIALERGMDPERYLELIKILREKHPEIPFITMTYYNLIAKDKNYPGKLLNSGIDGLIIPDLPLIEGKIFYRTLNKMGLATPMLIPPTIKGEYFNRLIKNSSGFIYAVSRSGTTGERDEIPEEGISLIKRLKKSTTKPVAIGFGIKTAGQVEPLKRMVDGIIIGSALIKKLENNDDIREWVAAIKKGAFNAS